MRQLPNRNQHTRVSPSIRYGLASILLALSCAIPMLAGCDTFTAANLGAPGEAGGERESAASPDSAAPAAADSLAAGQAEQVARDIEEADIVKVAGDKIYALNRFKGLLVIDVANPDAPQLVGKLELRGRGVEMYVVGSQVYIITSADFYYPYLLAGGIVEGRSATVAPDGPAPLQPDFQGSQLAIVNVTDPTAPALRGKLNLAGYASESRRVGDIIYVVGGNYVPYYYGGAEDEDAVDQGFVASVNVADPDNIIPVQRENIPGSTLIMHVSQTAIFAASQEYDYESAQTQTRVQAIDISDPAGAIVVRGAVEVPGTIRNRFYMDDYQDVLRIATQSWGFGFNEVRLFTYDLTNMDAIVLLGQTQIIQGESLEAVRFDGPRGYAVTFLRVDPLFVLDLHDPANPAVTGHLEVPGFSTHIEPRGNRLVAVGIDDTNGRRPAVSYYNVEDPANPTELGRVVLGPPGSFTESEAVYDEKAFKIVDELGLIAVPFKHVDYSSLGPWPAADQPIAEPGETGDDADGSELPACFNGVQLVDFDDAGLAQRGWFEHRGRVERVGVIGGRVWALSQVALRTVDITDRDNPVKLGQADFFVEGEMPYYADDCGGFDWPDDLPPDGQPDVPLDPRTILIQIFLNGDLCGTASPLPTALLPATMLFAVKPLARSGRRLRGWSRRR